MPVYDDEIQRRLRVQLLTEPEPHPDPEKGCVRRGYCCRTNPGWFGPGEVEQAAAVLGMDVDAFVRTHCIIHRVEVDGQTVHAFAPVKLGRDGAPVATPGTVVDGVYSMFPSPCVFFDGAGCAIYAARPVECRQFLCTRPRDENPSPEKIGRLWLEAAKE